MVFDAGFDHRQRIARLAANRFYVTPINPIMVKLIQAIAPDRIIGHAGDQGRASTMFVNRHPDIGR